MFLHLGGDVVINQSKIIAILDLETAMKNLSSENFLKKIKDKQDVIYISEKGKEKSLVVAMDGSYLSPISSTTLLKRSASMDSFEE